MIYYIEDLQRIQRLTWDVRDKVSKLLAMTEQDPNPKQEAKELEKLSADFEQCTLIIREACELHTKFNHRKALAIHAPDMEIAGALELHSDRWMHIKLETLLPHCKYESPAYLKDTLKRLMDVFEKKGSKLPSFEQAVLVIDEHSQVDGRHVYDQDNKGWKAIPNALKGRVIDDDDQYHLGVVMLSKPSPENVTHITILHPQDLPDFFALRESDYTSEMLYRGH